MRSPCLYCGEDVEHMAHEQPFCSVECNADYAERLVDMRTPLDERKQIVAWLRKLESVYSIQPRWLAKAIERGDHWLTPK
jgi:endogenous inhibitor of DNA gyrase (YacG/DUF329 family)